MSRVSLLFEDGEDGSIAFRADYHGGHQAGSQAHRLAGQVIRFLDEQAVKKEGIETISVPAADPVEHSRILMSNGEFH